MLDLIKTTYERSFDKDIIEKYLSSDSENKINAALLSISQSEDTTFIPQILKLDQNHFGNEIFFTLGQIGRCNESINFLWNHLNSYKSNQIISEAFFAIGKIGKQEDLDRLITYYESLSDSEISPDGIAEAILQFQIRGIRNDNAKSILKKDALSKVSNKERLNALFTLSRYGETQLTKGDFVKLFSSLNQNTDSIYNADLIQMLLMNINKPISLNYDDLFKEFKSEIEKFSFRINLVKVLHFIHFDDYEYPKQNLEIYFDFINGKNQNVEIQTAISLRKLKAGISDSLLAEMKSSIDNILINKSNSATIRGELFLTRYKLFNDFAYHQKLIKELDLPKKYLINFLANNPDKDNALRDLSDIYFSSIKLNDKIDALSEIINIGNKNVDPDLFSKIIKDALSANKAPLISISADGIDSLFIKNNSIELRKIISNQVVNYKNNPDFIESVMSLVNLSFKIDSTFYNHTISQIIDSKLFSVRKFLSTKSSLLKLGNKELEEFDKVYSYAFKYKGAIIKTTKGDFDINFRSDLAPISVANFCMLVKNNFYNGIIFHRVVPGFVIQAGDPTASGWGGPGHDIVSEFSNSPFNIGAIGMASAGKDTEGSQFFVMQGFYPHLNSRYTFFGKVEKGLETIFNITQDDKIISIKLLK